MQKSPVVAGYLYTGWWVARGTQPAMAQHSCSALQAAHFLRRIGSEQHLAAAVVRLSAVGARKVTLTSATVQGRGCAWGCMRKSSSRPCRVRWHSATGAGCDLETNLTPHACCHPHSHSLQRLLPLLKRHALDPAGHRKEQQQPIYPAAAWRAACTPCPAALGKVAQPKAPRPAPLPDADCCARRAS